MNRFYILSLFIFSSMLSVRANDLKPKVTTEELGYTDRAFITYFENIDNEHLGLIVEHIEDGYGTQANWVYNLKTKEAKNVTYTNEQGRKYKMEEYHTSLSPHGLRYFLKDGDLIYTIVNGYDSDDELEYSSYLIGTHLKTGEQNARHFRYGCQGFKGFMQSAGKNFLLETESCTEAFKLQVFDNSTWSEVWSVKDFGWESFFNYETKKPFYHKGKLYLSAQNKLYVFNMSDYKVDTIINDTRDVDGVKEGCASVVTQYFAHGDDVYIVFNDIRILNFYIVTAAMNIEGYTRIWKTNGTKNSTQLMKRLSKTDEYQGALSNSKLFVLDDRLLWLGDIDTLRQSIIYQIEAVDFEPLGKINYSTENIYDITYNTPYWHIRPLFNSIVPVRFENQDILVYTPIAYSDTNSFSRYLNVAGIEENQVTQYLENFPLNSPDSEWNFNDFKCFNIDEKLTVFRFGERKKEDTASHTTYMDFLISDSYKTIDFENYSPMKEGAYGQLKVVHVGDELLFGYGDNSVDHKSFIIWSWEGAVNTNTKTYTSDPQLHWKIYPNPASGSITVQSSEFLDGQLSIVGVDGKIHQILRMNGHQKQIDVSQLSNGVYIAIYQVGQDVAYERFVIQR